MVPTIITKAKVNRKKTLSGDTRFPCLRSVADIKLPKPFVTPPKLFRTQTLKDDETVSKT
jgi:hypothetical protein